MLREISIQEFYEWIAFSEIEPFDQERDDMRTAHICAVIANANRNPKRRPQSYTARDFALYFGDNKPKPKTPEQMKAVAKSIAAMFGGLQNQPEKRKRKEPVIRRTSLPRRPIPKKPGRR